MIEVSEKPLTDGLVELVTAGEFAGRGYLRFRLLGNEVPADDAPELVDDITSPEMLLEMAGMTGPDVCITLALGRRFQINAADGTVVAPCRSGDHWTARIERFELADPTARTDGRSRIRLQ